MPGTALVLIDTLSPYDFEDAEPLAASAATVVPNIRRVRDEALAAGVPVVYVNDNDGDWGASADDVLDRALAGAHPELVEPLRPHDGATFVMKLRHSIFYATPLEHLLRELGVGRVVLTGMVTEQCVLYSALDAYVREFDVVVPRDAVAHIDARLAEAALEMMARNMGAATPPTAARTLA